MPDSWAAAQQQPQQTGKTDQQKSQNFQQNQMQAPVAGKQPPHVFVQVKGATTKQLFKNWTCASWLANENMAQQCALTELCISQKCSQQIQLDCYFPRFSTCKSAQLQSTTFSFGLPSTRKVLRNQSKSSKGIIKMSFSLNQVW